MTDKILEVTRLACGGVRCHGCGKRLNMRTIKYRRDKFPMGRVEFVPVCQSCNGGVNR